MYCSCSQSVYCSCRQSVDLVAYQQSSKQDKASALSYDAHVCICLLQMMMSQDDDGCRIQWQASPQHHSLTPSQVGPHPCKESSAMSAPVLVICILAILLHPCKRPCKATCAMQAAIIIRGICSQRCPQSTVKLLPMLNAETARLFLTA